MTLPSIPVRVGSALTPAIPQKRPIMGLRESNTIEFVLRRHPQETRVDRLKKEFLRTSKDITVDALKKFLSKKLDHYPHSHFQVGARCGESNSLCFIP